MKSLLFKHTLPPLFPHTTRSLRLRPSAVSRLAVPTQRISFHNSPFLQLLFKHPKRTPARHLFCKPPYNTKPTPASIPLSALDFPICFLAVRWLGTDRIGHWEHVILEWVWKVVPNPFQAREAAVVAGAGQNAEESQSDEIGLAGYDHGVKEAELRNRSENASQ